jgi:hypothetical protein
VVAGLQKISLQNLMFPFKLDSYGKQKNNKEFNPDVVIGTGGLPADRY